MKRLILLIFLAFGMSAMASAGPGDFAQDDPLPWPWGTECPFPWTTIDGYWEVADEEVVFDYFEFETTSVRESGTRVFQIRHYNRTGEMIAEGRGVSQKGQRIVRAALTTRGQKKPIERYWAIVRTYVENETFSCEDRRLVTVLTLRPIGKPSSKDVHYLIEKVDADSETPVSEAR